MKILIKLLLSIILLIIASILCLYFLFPSDWVTGTISSQVKKVNPDLDISIEKASPVFPFSIKLENSNVYRNKRLVFDAETVLLTPDLISFLGRNNRVAFFAHAYDGSIKGHAEIDRNESNEDLRIISELSDIQVHLIPVLKDIDQFKITGIMSGHATYTHLEESLNSKITISEAVIKTQKPVLDVDTIAFKNIDADIKSINRKFEIVSCTFTGDQMDMVISGNATITENVQNSYIDLNGEIDPHSILHQSKQMENLLNVLPQLKKGKHISFNVKGPLDNPIFSFKLNN